MASLDLGGTVKALKNERTRMHQEIAKLDKAITTLEGIFGADSTSPNGNSGKRTMSASARRKIGKAQKLRWAKIKQKAAKK